MRRYGINHPLPERAIKRLLNIQCDILALTAAADQGPLLPPPDGLAGAVGALLEAGLLIEADGRIAITETGRLALDQERHRIALIGSNDGARRSSNLGPIFNRPLHDRPSLGRRSPG